MGNKKKKPPLHNFLSNLRNAQAVIGRAADDFHEREIRPLVSGGSGSGGVGVGNSIDVKGTKVVGARVAATPSQPQLRSAPPSASLSSTLNNFSQRFGSQLRKHNHNTGKRRKKGHGVTTVPQSFYVAVGCFFFAFPVFFVIYIVARHAVFGDETDNSVGKEHIHEVPPTFSVESWVEVEEGEEVGDYKDSNERAESSKLIALESKTETLQTEIKRVPGDVNVNLNQTTRDISDKSGSILATAIDQNASENTENVTGHLDLKEINSSNELNDITQTRDQARKVQGSGRSASTSLSEDTSLSVQSLKETGTNTDQIIEEELHQETLAGSNEKGE